MTDSSISADTLRAQIEQLIFATKYPFFVEAKETGKFVFWDDESIHQKDLDFVVAFAERMGVTTVAELDTIYRRSLNWSAELFRRLAEDMYFKGTDHWQAGPSTPYLLILVAAYAHQASPADLCSIGWDKGSAKNFLDIGAGVAKPPTG